MTGSDRDQATEQCEMAKKRTVQTNAETTAGHEPGQDTKGREFRGASHDDAPTPDATWRAVGPCY